MSMTKGISIGILALVVIGGGWFALSNQGDKDAMMQKEDTSMQKDESPTIPKDDSMMEQKDETAMMLKTGSYETYSAEKLAFASDGDVLLFFHATWCPICRGIESEINADLSAIPADVHILKVNYDTATALRQKYGVMVQHTFVQVDAQGNLIQKFSDASKLGDVLAKVK